MFFFRKLAGLFLFGLIVLGFMGLIGGGRHGRTQEAYQEGFIAGQQTAAAQSEAAPDAAEGTSPTVPTHRPGANIYYRGHGFFFPGFGLLLCLVPFFLIGMLFMGFGKRRWHGHRHHRGPWGHPHKGGHGPWGRGPCGPRKDWQDSPQEKSPGDIDDGPDEPIMRA